MFNIKQKTKDAWGWIKSQTKKILIGLGIMGVAVAATGVVLQPSPEEKLIDSIKASQDQFKAERGQYVHQPKYFDSKTNSYVMVNEYKKPDGQRGYWIVIQNDKGLKSIGYGPDATHLTYEVLKPLPTDSIASTTPQ